MHTFRVWAPVPKKVELVLNGKNFPMTPAPDGWWTAAIPAQPGDRYGFLLDGAGPFPDPRSPAQPDGVHGLSAVTPTTTFRWSDQHWNPPPLASAIIYELHLGTFTRESTFRAASEKLDHLLELGVTHVELMPANEFSGNHGWGYDGVDLFAPHHAYGTPDDLKQLVDTCHSRGLAVILDVVYNHLGPSGNYLGKYGPYFTKKFATFWGEGINFDGPDSTEVRRFFCDNALMWLRDFHFDGLRLDAVHGIIDTSATHFLEQLQLEVENLSTQLGRHLFLIPESDLNDPELLWSRERGGFQLAAQWSDDFHHALHTVLIGERTGYYSDFGKIAHLAKALRQAYVYDGIYSPHRRRVHGRPAQGLSGRRFLGYLQNHDQVGNRALGDRSSRLMSVGRLKIGAALVLTSPFVPMLFQGEEWAARTPFLFFTDHREPELARGVREGRCREFAAFGWKPEDTPDPQAPETFQKSKLDWQELERSPHQEMLQWHQQLIQLRRTEPALADDDLAAVNVRFDEEKQWLVVERGNLAVVCNLGERAQSIPTHAREIVLASDAAIKISDGTVELPADAVAIIRQ